MPILPKRDGAELARNEYRHVRVGFICSCAIKAMEFGCTSSVYKPRFRIELPTHIVPNTHLGEATRRSEKTQKGSRTTAAMPILPKSRHVRVGFICSCAITAMKFGCASSVYKPRFRIELPTHIVPNTHLGEATRSVSNSSSTLSSASTSLSGGVHIKFCANTILGYQVCRFLSNMCEH
ncbi:hypothetical protein ACROYT_G004849 [Oculina patagonica]